MNRLDQIRAAVHDLERRHHAPGATALQRYAHAELRAETDPDTGATRIQGHAAVFNVLSHDLGGFREQLKRGVFRRALDENHDVVALINHQPLPILGRTTVGTLQLREDPRGLFCWIEAAGDHPDITHVRGAISRGEITGMSFGFRGAKDEWVEKDGVITRTITDIGELFDVSVVTFPAYPQTDVRGTMPVDTTMTATPPGGDGTDPPTGIQEARTLDAAWRRRRLHLHQIGGGGPRTNPSKETR